MKILQINAVYGQRSTGTIVRDIEHLSEQYGIKSYVASPDPKVLEAKNGYLIGNIFDHKLHALLSRITGKQAYFSHIPTWNLCRYIDKIKPDIVHIHNVHSNYIHFNNLLKHLAKRNIKTIITLHDCWPYTGGCFHYSSINCNKWMKNCGDCPKLTKKNIFPLFDCSRTILLDREKFINSIPKVIINGVSEWISNECRMSVLRNHEIITIRNGVNLNIFKPTQIPLECLSLQSIKEKTIGKRIILAPASKWFLPINKHVLQYFIEHMKENEILLIYGVSNKPISLPSNVITYGYINSREEMAALYTMSDVFVNCTREESLSLVNVECQACGTPVVTFNATAPKETVDNINSFSVQVGNAEALYNKTEYVLQHIAGKCNKACREFVSKEFELHANYKKYIDLYLSIK